MIFFITQMTQFYETKATVCRQQLRKWNTDKEERRTQNKETRYKSTVTQGIQNTVWSLVEKITSFKNTWDEANSCGWCHFLLQIFYCAIGNCTFFHGIDVFKKSNVNKMASYTKKRFCELTHTNECSHLRVKWICEGESKVQSRKNPIQATYCAVKTHSNKRMKKKRNEATFCFSIKQKWVQNVFIKHFRWRI